MYSLSRSRSHLWMSTFGLLAFASCVDPFAVDKTPKRSTGGTMGSGGATGTGGMPVATGTGGAVNSTGGAIGTGGAAVGSGGSSSTGGASATGGSSSGGATAATGGRSASGGATASGGAVGSGGAANPDAGATGGSSVDGGAPDAPMGTGGMMVLPAPVQPPEPFPINNCPPEPTPPAGEDLSCPFNVSEIANWLPVTPPMRQGGGCRPPAHPETECLFYLQSFQEYMIATQPNSTGKPAFLNWNTIENTFGAGAGQPTPAVPVLVAGVTQAGGRQVVIDQNGHALYYGMHLNPAFVNFVKAARLTSADQIKRAPADLHFITTDAIVETKEAWMIIPDNNPPQATNFITTRAMVPTLHVDPQGGVLADDNNLRMVTVALIAIHVVHTVPGHPEFIWSTFQHTNAMGITDVAPTAATMPNATPLTTVLSTTNHLLYRAGTTVANANRGVFVPTLNEATQTFTTPPTSIYRPFPASKSVDPEIDDDVAAVNDAMTTRFNTNPRAAANDRRMFYRLVGAVWMDQPTMTVMVNRALINDESDPDIIVNGSDSTHAINGGEDRLSSTAMESFTQAGASFPGCFNCHDTQATTANGVPQSRNPSAPVLMKPGLINVSHIFNEVVRLNIN